MQSLHSGRLNLSGKGFFAAAEGGPIRLDGQDLKLKIERRPDGRWAIIIIGAAELLFDERPDLDIRELSELEAKFA
jgi:hypothetical protein